MKNPIVEPQNNYDRRRILEKFPELNSCPQGNFLAVRKYIAKIPEKYYSESVRHLVLEWLELRDQSSRQALLTYFSNESQNLSKAFLFLRQINELHIHDSSFESIDEYNLVRIIDETIHPQYLRLVEAIFVHFTKLIAHFLRVDRSSGVDGLDVYTQVQEITKSTLSIVVRPYVHMIRNGIAHGGIKYRQNEIEYRDKKGNTETHYTRSIPSIFDELVDTCNALALAFKEFLLVHQNDGYRIPHELMIEELVEETRSPWWRVEGCVESEDMHGSQLIVYARPNTVDYGKVLLASLQTAVVSELLAPGYGRYFISIRSQKCLPSFGIFKGPILKKIRESGTENIEQFRDVFESPGLFFSPKYKIPKALAKIDTFVKAFQVNARLHYEMFLDRVRKATLEPKNAKIHRNSWGVVLAGEIVLEVGPATDIVHYIRTNAKKLICRSLKVARRKKTFLQLEKYLPLGYARIYIFRRTLRKRFVEASGLGSDLVCTVQIKRIKRIQAPDIYNSVIETVGAYRIAWNRNWLSESGCGRNWLTSSST